MRWHTRMVWIDSSRESRMHLEHMLKKGWEPYAVTVFKKKFVHHLRRYGSECP